VEPSRNDGDSSVNHGDSTTPSPQIYSFNPSLLDNIPRRGKIMDPDSISLKWTSQLCVTPSHRTRKLVGDKIFLPPSALEQLLAAAPTVSTTTDAPHNYTPNFDPYNPYSYAAERQARQQFVDRQQQLPHPLTFRIVNPENGRVVYAGIREFSAKDDEVGLSNFLRQALGLEVGDEKSGSATPEVIDLTDETIDLMSDNPGLPKLPKVTVHAKQLPKGTYVRLRPLEAGYDPEDWKSLLERYLRDNFTTLTNGEILTVPGARNEMFQFLIDKFAPEGDGICIVDTDLEVDIEALNEEQARETLKRKLAKSQKAPGTKEGSSSGGKLKQGEIIQGQVLEGEYVDYELRSWDKQKGLEVELEAAEDAELDIFVSPFAPTQRARPRDDEHVFSDFSSHPNKRIRLSPTNVALENAEAIYISIHAYQDPASSSNSSLPTSAPKPPSQYSLQTTSFSGPAEVIDLSDDPPNPDDARCKNCHQWIPSRTMMLHENFCYRNNILCPHCSLVFQKRSPEWQNHWHCPHDTSSGNTPASQSKHNDQFHPSSALICPSCSESFPSLPALATHRTTTCPGKLILCQFCHLLVPQQGETDPLMHDPQVLLSGLTPHELADGARTTECHLCNRITRLRDMKTHLRHHDLERLSKPKPRVCRNENCGRVASGNDNNEQLGLCNSCFGPLYVAMYDPDGKALKRRIERRYLSQVMSGCGKPWCQNKYCKTGGTNAHPGSPQATVTAKDALPMIKPLVDSAVTREPVFFCVDEASQRRRAMAEMMATTDAAMANGNSDADGEEKSYELEWCIAALEAEHNDMGKAREWLKGRAPGRGEVMGSN